MRTIILAALNAKKRDELNNCEAGIIQLVSAPAVSTTLQPRKDEELIFIQPEPPASITPRLPPSVQIEVESLKEKKKFDCMLCGKICTTQYHLDKHVDSAKCKQQQQMLEKK